MCASRQHMSRCKDHVRNSRAIGNHVFIMYLGLLNLPLLTNPTFLGFILAF